MTPDEQPQPVASKGLNSSFPSAVKPWAYYRAHDGIGPVQQIVLTSDLHCGSLNLEDGWIPLYAHPPTSAASQPDAVRVTEEMITAAHTAIEVAQSNATGEQVNDFHGYRRLLMRAALNAVLNPPAESAARGEGE